MNSDSFKEKLLLLIIAAALTGLLAPILSSYIEHRRLQQQKLHEEDQARQTRIVQSQSDLLNKFSDLVIEYEFLAFEPVYYMTWSDTQRFEATYKQYDERALGYFSKIRGEIYKSKRLVSDTTYKMMLDILEELQSLDLRLVQLAKRNGDLDAWKKFEVELRELMETTTPAKLNQLAEEMKLSANTKSSIK